MECLINEEARRDAIRTAMEVLIEKTKRGDVVVFFFSGHGQQIGNLDEAVVPFDEEVFN